MMAVLCPQDVGIILSYRCHSGCKHCLYNCGPGWAQEPMSREMLQRALEAVLHWSQTPQVHLTGGEPFLHADLLLEGVHIASDLGIRCYVETSASWCLDEDSAVERFRELREAGLQALLISCSPFHAERIPPIRTLRAIHAALKVFGPHRTLVYQSDFVDVIQRFGTARPTPLSRYEQVFGLQGARQILWSGYGIISGGRAGYHLGHLVPRHPAEAFVHDDCVGEILYAHHSHLDLYGNFISGFCGGLTVGDWHDLPQLLADFTAARYPTLIRMLIERGPYGLCEWARDAYGYKSLPDGYTGKCHLCVDVRSHLVKANDLVELQPKEFYAHI